ncbi:hypothetical protein F4802DRAFT_601620 [Xylaria palmicola]|nr:hypothetical protein F4802DRAFT_601620 [Xylaria palmicola]
MGSVTTEIIAVSTTVCPVSDKSVPADVKSTQITLSNTYSNSVVVITSVITYIDTPVPHSATETMSTTNRAGPVDSTGAKTTQPCTTLMLGNYFTTVITYASLTKQPPTSVVPGGSLLTSFYTVSPIPSSDVPSYTMTDVASTVEISHPSSSSIFTTTSVAATQGHPGGGGGGACECPCPPPTAVSTVYATVTETVAETTVTSTRTVDPPFPSAGTGTGAGTAARQPTGTGSAKRRWFRRAAAQAGHGHGR